VTIDHRSRRLARQPPLRRIAVVGAIVFVAMLVWGLFGPDVPIRVSRETTFLTKPLAADGLPDYRAAMLAAMGPVPKPEDNAAVELLQVMWPLGIQATDLPAVCKALGITDVAPVESLQEPSKEAAAEMHRVMFDPSGSRRPWAGAEFPEIEAWLVAQEAALDRLVAAADRPRCWLPWPVLLGSESNVCQSWGPNMRCRDVANTLCWRAMWHAGAGRHAAAWRDIRAVYRFSRLLANPTDLPPGASAFLHAFDTSAQADAALTHGLLALPGLPAELLGEIRRDLDRLGPLSDPADLLGGERLNAIDWITFLYRMPGGRTARRQALERTVLVAADAAAPSWFEAMWSRMDSDDQLAVRTSLDWNVALEWVNAYFDAADSAMRLPSHAARKAAIERLERDFILRSKWGAAGHFVKGIGSREFRSSFFGNSHLISLYGYLDISSRGQASFDLARIAAALAAWKADRANDNEPYPKTLDELVPQYLSAVPLDSFIEKPLLYERRGEGYLLASAGDNGAYDGGDDRNGWIVGGEWQESQQEVDRQKSDIVVRIPVPALAPR
jgi:hypothetical protein